MDKGQVNFEIMKKKSRNEVAFYVYRGTPNNFILLVALWEPNVCMLTVEGKLCFRIREVKVHTYYHLIYEVVYRNLLRLPKSCFARYTR